MTGFSPVVLKTYPLFRKHKTIFLEKGLCPPHSSISGEIIEIITNSIEKKSKILKGEKNHKNNNKTNLKQTKQCSAKQNKMIFATNTYPC
jgi:hypothetical protein